MAMTSGKADPQQLYMGGQLKIAGNVMASTKLGFLKKIDMKAAQTAIAANRAKGASAAPTAAATAAPKAAQAPAIADRIAAKLAAAKTDTAVSLTLRVKDPASEWSLTLGPQGGAITSGTPDKPVATITIGDDDLAALAHGKTTTQKLFQQGKLRVDGDVRAAHHLSLIEGALS